MPNPTGLNDFVFASPKGMGLYFEITQGKSSLASVNTPKRRVALGAVIRLAEPFLQGTALLFDRYFNTMPLLGHLAQSNLRAIGTIMRNRIPKDGNIRLP